MLSQTVLRTALSHLGSQQRLIATTVPAIGRRGNLQHSVNWLNPLDCAMLARQRALKLLQPALEFCLGKKRAGQLQKLVGLAQLIDFALQFLDSLGLGIGNDWRAPLSTSDCLTQSSTVCGTQPIFRAIDSIAAHSDGYSPRCSCTIRTARSRTSG